MEFRTWDLEGKQIKLDEIKNQVYKQIYFRFLLQILSLQNVNVWIGLNDKETEGTWVWVNEERAMVPANVLWTVNQLDNAGGHEDWGEIRARNEWGYGTNDFPRNSVQLGLCEKRSTF